MSTNKRLPEAAACQRAAEQMLSYALEAGADGVEVMVRDGAELEVRLRLGEPELIKEAGSRALGLRVIKDQRPAVTYTSDFTEEGLRRLARESVELASLAEPDPFALLPAREVMARTVPDLDLWDDEVPNLTVELALEWTKRGEAAAQARDKRITNSDGASFSRVVGATAFATSAGFSGGYRGTYVSLVVQPLADDEGGKKRNGSWWTGGRFVSALETPESVGQTAADRTLAQLGSQKVATCEVPVIFAPEAGRSLMGKLAGVTSGGAVWRKSTYLADREGTEVASPLIHIVDDPLIPRAPGSRPFDGEGLASRPNVIVDGGILRTFLCDTYAARKLNRVSTGSAGRGIGGSAHVTTSNLILRAGSTPKAKLEQLPEAFYVTHLMGFGFNAVTGDFSQGASGFWIKNGERAFPVSEVTISSSFDNLWKNVDALGDDLDARSSVQVPTIRVSHMMIAGR
ncbi:MAG: metallopeptidase TldD-related protein [Deltaproteobacteria bacterium]|nr:metallopeptidase TldD-related protein [Deltaproteobacteria bacterium]